MAEREPVARVVFDLKGFVMQVCPVRILSLVVLLGLSSLSPSSLVADDFVNLFDGTTLDGWEVRPAKDAEKYWRVDAGTIIAENPDKAGNNLWTKKNYRNYEMELEFKTSTDDYDTGVFLRGDGHQVQIGISGSLKTDMTACIYAPKDGKGGYPGQTDKVKAFNKVGEWNHLKIILTGKRIQTFLNGEPFVDYTGDKINDEGPIGLQLHPNRVMKVHFRNVRLKELGS